jgi:hypothetical protein
VGRVAPMEGTGNAYGIFAVNAKGNVRWEIWTWFAEEVLKSVTQTGGAALSRI